MRGDDRYVILKKSGSDLPSLMFEKFVSGLQTRYLAHAKQAKVLAASCPKLSSADSFDDFVAALKKQEAESRPKGRVEANAGEDIEDKTPVLVDEMMEEAVRHVYKLVIERLEQVRVSMGECCRRDRIP